MTKIFWHLVIILIVTRVTGVTDDTHELRKYSYLKTILILILGSYCFYSAQSSFLQKIIN